MCSSGGGDQDRSNTGFTDGTGDGAVELDGGAKSISTARRSESGSHPLPAELSGSLICAIEDPSCDVESMLKVLVDAC